MVQTLALYEREDSEYIVNGTTTGTQSLPEISWISSSRYVAIWTHDPQSDGLFNTEIRAQIFEADGTPVGAEFTVNSQDPGDQTNAVVAQLAGGGFVVAWEDREFGSDGSGASIRYRVYGADGTPLGADRLANTTVSLDQSRPSIAGLEGGGFVITWTDASLTGADTSGAAVRGQLFVANGDLAGSEFLVNTVTSRDQTGSNVTALADGGFAVVWEDGSPQGIWNGITSREDFGSDIAIQIFDSSATKVGPQRVVDDMTPPPVYVFSDGFGRVTAQDAVAVLLEGGAIAVVWRDAYEGYVKTRLLNSDGTPSTAVFNVGDWAGAGHPGPAIVALAGGGYAVSWTTSGDGPPDGSGSGILTRVFGADGSPQGVEFQANTTSAGNQLASAMLAFADGGFLVVWQDGTSTDLAAQRFREDAGTIGDIALSVPSISKAAIENVQAAILSADGALNAPFTYQLLNDPTGAFRIEGDRLVVDDTALLYTYGPNQATVTFRATDSNGNSFDEAILIPLTESPASAVFVAGTETAVTTPSSASTAQTPEITSLSDGGYFLTWVEHAGSGFYDVKGQFFEADGSAGAQFVVNTVTAGSQFQSSAVVLENGNLVVIWTGPAQQNSNTGTMIDVRGQILDPSGAKIGPEFVVNTAMSLHQLRAVPTALADGGFLVTWTDQSASSDPSGGGIKAQFFASDATKVGSEFLVNTTTAGAQTDPYAAQLSNGTIVIAWTDPSATGGDSSGTAVRARLYTAAGAPIGGEFLVNTATLFNQSAPVVTALADGRFVVVWGDTSEGTGSTGTFDPADLRGQIFDSSGNKVGGEFLVNSETAGFQGQGSLGIAGVAADPDGGFVVSWSTSYQVNADDDLGSVKAQLFGADGGKVGNEFLVNQIGAGHQSTPAVAYLGDGDLLFAYWDVFPRVGDNRGLSMRRFDAAVQSTLPNVIEGTPADDILNGTAGPDLISGYGGFDTLSGGGGNDVVHGGDDDDFLLGEDGDDQLFGDEGYDLLRGGAGVDHFDGGPDGAEQGGDRISFFEARATQGVVADLRTGIISNDGFGNAETMENVESLGGDTAYVDTFYGNDSDNFLSAGRGDYLYAFGDDDVLQLVAAAAVVDGGDGLDYLRLVSNTTGYLPDSNGDGNAELAPVMATGYTVNLAAGTLRDGYGNVGTVAGIEWVGGSHLSDDLRGDSGDNLLIGNDGADIFRLQDGGVDSVSGGNGNDNIFFIGSLTSADIVNGGSGTDTLVVQGNYAGGLTLSASVTQIENVSILGGGNTNFGEPGTNRYDYGLTTNDVNFAAGLQVRVNGAALLEGEDFTFNGSAETDAKFVVYGGKGVDTLTGGYGNDIFIYAEDRFAPGDTVNGGPGGYDGIFFRGNYTIDFNAPGYFGLMTGIENMTLMSITDERYSRGGDPAGFDYNITLADNMLLAGVELTVSGVFLMAGEIMIVDGSQELDGTFRLFGGKGNDTLKGGAQNDLLLGNLGADQLTGGGGSDTFRFDGPGDSNSANMDQILDFTPGTDKIDLIRTDANTLVAENQFFTWIGSNAFSGSAGQLRVYEQGGTWFVEGDVNGDAVADLVIALTLQGPTPLGQGDFLL